MKDSSLSHIFTREVQDLSGDIWLLSLVSWIPIVLYATMWWIFSQGMATDVPIGIVDFDKSRISRSLIRHYDASPSLQVAHSYLTVQNGADALRTGQIYALIILPNGLEEDLITGRPPQVSAFVNSQFLLIGKIINSTLLQTQGTYAVKVEAFKNMALSTPLPDAALSAAMPITTQSTPLFNIGKNYAWFLVSAILPALWQIIMVSATVLSLALVKRRYTLASWFQKDAGIRLLVKFSLLGILFIIQGLFFLAFMYKWLGWPMHGQWPLLLAGQAMTVVASIGCGSLLFFLTRDAARSLSLAAAYVAPGLAFMGVTFPVTDMTLPARIWRSLIPVCHYIEIQFGQVNYGLPPSETLSSLQSLALFILMYIPVFFIAYRLGQNRHTKTAEVAP